MYRKQSIQEWKYNLWNTAFKKLELIWSVKTDHITLNFLKAAFHNFYLAQSWIPCLNHSVLLDFSPTKFKSKIMSPLFASFTEISHFGSPTRFCGSPTGLQYSSFSPSKIFNFCLADLPKLTTNTFSNCVISCTTQEKKQVEANLYFKYTNTFSSQLHTKLQEIANYGIGNSFSFKQKILRL